MEEEPALGTRRGDAGREWGPTHTGSEMAGPFLCVDPACLRAGLALVPTAELKVLQVSRGSL